MRRSGNGTRKTAVFAAGFAFPECAFAPLSARRVPAHHLAAAAARHFRHMPIAAHRRIVVSGCIA